MRTIPAAPLGEAVVVTAAVVVVVGLAGAPAVGGALDVVAVGHVLTLAAATVAAGAAILGAFGANLLDDPRPRWIAAALALYAVIVLPASAVATDPGPPLQALRLVAYLVTIALLVAAVRPPRRLGITGTWVCAAAGALLAVLALGAPAVAPGLVAAAVGSPVVTVVAVAGWTAVAAAVLVEGLHRRSAPRRRVGLGLVVLAGAQLHRVLTSVPGSSGDLVFVGMRLLALLVVLAGLAQLVRRTLADLHTQQFAQQEELSVAALHMERAAELAAERDHELRNGLAGLAGITHLLSSPAGDADHARLRHAVLEELGRLHRLLDSGADAGPAATDYVVAPVLDGLVALRGPAGAAPVVEVEPGLRAVGDPALLAQVVTNLLANCDRHAPGTDISVRARADGEHAVIEVRDSGPGLPGGASTPGSATDVLRRGVHDPAAGGSGLGLSISARLAERDGGVLSVRTVTDPPGCLATITLPLSAAAPTHPRPPVAGPAPQPPAPPGAAPAPGAADRPPSPAIPAAREPGAAR